jgi:hypothetical protein
VDSLFYDVHLKPEKLAGLTPAQMTMTAGCAVYWKMAGDHFVGYMKPKACNFVSKRSGKKIFIIDSLMLNKEEIWIRDEAEDEDGKYVFGNKDKIPHKLKKCKNVNLGASRDEVFVEYALSSIQNSIFVFAISCIYPIVSN